MTPPTEIPYGADELSDGFGRLGKQYFGDITSLTGPLGVPWVYWIVGFLLVWKFGFVRLWLWAMYADEGPRLWRYVNPALAYIVGGFVVLTIAAGPLLFLWIVLMEKGVVLIQPGQGVDPAASRSAGPSILLVALGVGILVMGYVVGSKILRTRCPWLFPPEQPEKEIDPDWRTIAAGLRDLAIAGKQRRSGSLAPPSPLVQPEPAIVTNGRHRQRYFWRAPDWPRWLILTLGGINVLLLGILIGFLGWATLAVPAPDVLQPLFSFIQRTVLRPLSPQLIPVMQEVYPVLGGIGTLVLLGMRHTLIGIADAAKRYREYKKLVGGGEASLGPQPFKAPASRPRMK